MKQTYDIYRIGQWISSAMLVGLFCWWAAACGPTTPPGQDGGGWPDGNIVADTMPVETAPQPEPTVPEPKPEPTTPEAPVGPETQEKEAPRPTNIETSLDKNTAKAGDPVAVTCDVKDQYGDPITVETRVEVTPLPKGFIKPNDVTIHEAGSYKVACQLIDGSLTDKTPEELVITGAEASTVDTEVKPTTIKAGGSATVSCLVRDRFGNPVPGNATVDVQPLDKIVLKNNQITGTKTGQYNITCQFGGLADPTPATLDITPGLPAKITVVPDPAQPYYKPEETILLERKVYDAHDNIINNAPIKVTPTPNTKVDTSGYPDSIAFGQDGLYQVVVAVDGQTEGGAKVEASLTLKVDGNGPTVTITAPQRAAMLTGNSTINITGNVKDSVSGVKELKVNGKTIQPDANGNFRASMKAVWGLNLIVVDTIDKAGNAGFRGQSFLWSTQYRSPGSSTKAARSAIVRLNKPAIDDGNRSTLNDLASILEKVINSIDIDSQVPQTLVTGKYKIPPFGPNVSYSVTKNGKVTMGKRTVTLAPRVGGFTIKSVIYDVKVPLRGHAAGFLNKSVTITASSVTLNGSINLSYSNGNVNVSVASLTADVSNVKVNAFSGIFKFLNGLVTSALRNTIKKSLENAIKKAIPDPIKQFIQGVSFDKDFTLPTTLSSKVLRLRSQLDYLVFDANGGTLGLAASVTATKGIPDGKRGTPLRGQTLPSWSNTGYSFGVGLAYDILNQTLVAAWYSGALNQDISQKLGTVGSGNLPLNPKNLKMVLDAKLPPILHVGSGTNNIEIGMGDLLLDVSFNMPGTGQVVAKAYLTARFAAKVSITSNNELTFALNPTPTAFAVDIIQISGIGAVNVGEFGKLLQTLAPQISQFISSDILRKMPIPNINLGSLGGKYGIPPNTSLTLTNGKVSPASDYLQITGNLK